MKKNILETTSILQLAVGANGDINSYIAPNLVEKCHLKKSKLETTCLVHLAIGTKRKIT